MSMSIYNTNTLIPLTVALTYSTGYDVSIQEARKEVLKNSNNGDRLTKSPDWTKEKNDYYLLCYKIVNEYRKAFEKGIIESKPFSNKK